MRKNILFILIIIPFLSFAQKEPFKLCDSILTDKWKFQYYSFKTKYPISSEKLTAKVNKTLAYKPKTLNGFVTVRFVVNCKGQTGNFEIYQINNNYEIVKFEDKYIEQILIFVKTLENWKIATYKGQKLDYYTYLSFKIENGKVIEIVP